MTTLHEHILASVARELAEAEARQAPQPLPPRGRARVPGQSTVYSFRLDPDEVAALERRAALVGIRPTILARNLVREGLSNHSGAELSAALQRLGAALDEVRGLLH